MRWPWQRRSDGAGPVRGDRSRPLAYGRDLDGGWRVVHDEDGDWATNGPDWVPIFDDTEPRPVPSGVMDLIEFLRARLDEDESQAQQELDSWNRATERGPITNFPKWMVDPVIGPFNGQTRLRNVATGLYVGRVASPARVLAEVDAKRRIIELRESAADQAARTPKPAADLLALSVVTYDATLRLLALPYADHPDFDPAWKISPDRVR